MQKKEMTSGMTLRTVATMLSILTRLGVGLGEGHGAVRVLLLLPSDAAKEGAVVGCVRKLAVRLSCISFRLHAMHP